MCPLPRRISSIARAMLRLIRMASAAQTSETSPSCATAPATNPPASSRCGPAGPETAADRRYLILSCGSHAAVKIFQICAATQRHVLAIVHMFAVRQHIGRCPAAQKWPLLEQAHAPAGFSQRDARRQPRQPAADHDHVLQEYSLPCGARTAPWQPTSIFPLSTAAPAPPKTAKSRDSMRASSALYVCTSSHSVARLSSSIIPSNRRAFFVQLPRALRLKSQQFAHAQAGFASCQNLPCVTR